MPQLSDPSKFISYTCGEDTGYDEGYKFNGETYGLAVDDYGFLQKLSKRDKLGPIVKELFNFGGGKRFLEKRCTFYDSWGKRMS